MDRLPTGLPPATRELLLWLRRAPDDLPLAASLVPGASERERQRLAMLGAVVAKLLGEDVQGWPLEVTEWLRASTNAPDAQFVELVAESVALAQGEIFSSAYEWIVKPENRRRLGTFFTPLAVVNYMVQLAIESRIVPSHIVDPGAGVGAFSVAGIKAWPEARVHAIDTNAVTLGLLAAQVRLTLDTASEASIELTCGDYLSWIKDEWERLESPRLVLGNPPYTRHQLMTSEYKKYARRAAAPIVEDGNAGLATHFLAASLAAMRAPDSLCMLLPATWCETRYGSGIRNWLWEARHRRVELHFFPSETAIFPGTQVSAMILFIGPVQDKPQFMKIARLSYRYGQVTTSTLTNIERLRECPRSFYTWPEKASNRASEETVVLADHTRVRRGVVTGASRWFFITDTDRIRHQLPSKVLRRAVLRPGHLRESTITVGAHDHLLSQGHPGWLLDLNLDFNGVGTPEISRYLALARDNGAANSVLAQRRKRWYLIENVESPELLLVPVAHGSFRVMRNDAQVAGSNNFFGITVSSDAPWPPEQLRTWLCSARGQASMFEASRHYQGGAYKIEPRDLQTLRVPLNIEASSRGRE